MIVLTAPHLCSGERATVAGDTGTGSYRLALPARRAGPRTGRMRAATCVRRRVSGRASCLVATTLAMVATRGRVRAFQRMFPQVHLGIGPNLGGQKANGELTEP